MARIVVHTKSGSMQLESSAIHSTKTAAVAEVGGVFEYTLPWRNKGDTLSIEYLDSNSNVLRSATVDFTTANRSTAHLALQDEVEFVTTSTQSEVLELP